MEAQTFHCIDEPVLMGPAEWFLFFVEQFRFPLRMRSLSPDGREARFIVTDLEAGRNDLKRANRVIKILRLPLTPRLDYKEIGGIVHSLTLVITYTGK